MDKYGIEDLLVHTIEQKPSEFEAAFNNIIMDRLSSAIQDKKMEIASRIYGQPDLEEVSGESNGQESE